ncbi:MAG: prepilin peptidase [bacterium]|nr:prepilin peptidase [bacterium]
MTGTFLDLPPWAALAAATVLGACCGSFSNVLIHRLPRNLGVVKGRSFCPQCGKQIAWFDNVPVLSWALLGGKCRHCSARIPARYPLVELAGAACAAVGVLRFDYGPEGWGAALLLLLLVNVALIDWEHMIIPHTLTVVGMVAGLALAAVGAGPGLDRAILGLLVGAGVVLAVSWGWKLARGMMGMGFGDVMLMGMVGAFLGPWAVPAVIFGGALAGTVWALAAGRGRLEGTAKLPFGTFLAGAAAVVLLGGNELAAWYLGRF